LEFGVTSMHGMDKNGIWTQTAYMGAWSLVFGCMIPL